MEIIGTLKTDKRKSCIISKYSCRFENNRDNAMQILRSSRDFLCGLVLIAVVLSFSSCANMRQLTYLQGQFDTARLSQVNPVDPIIRKGDLLSIIVFSDNPEATKIYNQSLIVTPNTSGSGALSATPGMASSGGSTASPTAPGYQVDEKGDIVFQGLGKLHIEGLTKAQLKDTLDAHLNQYLANPYYNIRFLNYKFTMLGEVGKPGVISIPGERVNLLEALSLAGDMTFYGRRDNVLVIRENNNKREFARLDLTKPEIMASPYFYLQQNDLVIVEANNKKAAANDVVTARNISIALAFVSTFAIIYSLFRR
ncbi:MAG: polysaccharide biosynthesis/export family protein [Bacteroidetes bacterium]|nr:polysaccharide biosynthesis/export family protein [Bacteroidota bacterium]